jgi:serine/threonine-protein kinase
MTLSTGTRLGAYEILGSLGAGGMGEVYRARDTKLNRDVAIKVLPDALAGDPERLARFEREAQMLAALNHPHIAQIYGLERREGPERREGQEGREGREGSASSFIVMELVDGLTLAELIGGTGLGASGKPRPVPLEEALPIAKQIADALEAAHEQGIVHRDLKPANIKVRDDGTVKVLDFGLAKAFDSGAASSVSAAMSPTLSIHATQAGVILGSAAYMAPEQARGKHVDKRADIWAFGVVVFEMLTATRAFEGDDISSTLASVLKSDPDWNALPPATPAALVRLLKRCLQKDPRERLRDVGEVRIAIAGLLSGTSGELRTAAAAPRAASSPWSAVLWTTAALGVVAAVVMLTLWAPWRTPARHVVQRYSAEIGADASLVLAGNGSAGAAAAFSPDGMLLAMVAQKSPGAPSQLYVRRLDQLKATLLPGTEEAMSPFFSPDGQWIGFFAGGKLKKISVSGGAAVTVCDAPNSRGGSWTDDGAIVFQPSGASAAFLMRVASAGGTPEPLSALAPGEQTQRWPQVLPGGRGLIYTSSNTIGNYAEGTISYQPLPSGPKKALIRNGYFGRYFASGHLVYVHDGSLFAAPFDLARIEVTGQAAPVLEDVGIGITNGSAQFAASSTGTLAYVTGQSSITNATTIVWLDRHGTMTPIRKTPADWSNIQFAPDGQRLAFDISDGKQTDVWVYDWARDALTRVTLDPGEHWMPIWTPDGRRITYRWNRTGSAPNLFWRRADGGGDVQRLTSNPTSQYSGAWHPSAKVLAFAVASNTGSDVSLLPMDGDESSGWKPGTATTFLAGHADLNPAFSADGRWIAYQSNESGPNQIYVRPFPGPGGKWLISTEGGSFPVWSRVRKELLYAGPDNRIMMASYTATGDTFTADKPRPWANARFLPRPRGFGGATGRPFDLHPDGDRVAIAPVPENEQTAKQDKLVFILNFFDELRRIAPPSKP